MHKILLVEDDAVIRQMIKKMLEQWGYQVVAIEDFMQVLTTFVKEEPQLVLMDIGLPLFNGYHWCQEIRKISTVPIMFLSSRDQSMDIVMAINMGADDYVTKPFSNRELQARVKALLRRTELMVESQTESISDSDILIGDLKIIPDAFLAQKKGKELELTHREFELLYHLATHVGQVMTREHLLETVWGYDYFGDVRTLDVTIRRLREKIEDIPGRPEYILTRRGVGYYMRNND